MSVAGQTTFLTKHFRRPTIQKDGLETWLTDQIEYLEGIRRTKFGDGSLASYKHVLREWKLANEQP